MLRLRTLGSFGVTDVSGAVTSLPPHRLALLALLATSGDRGIARDKILAYLWPDSTTAKARASLEQMLHALRVSLNDRSALLGNPLRLDPAVVSSDVSEFKEAIAAGNLERAAALYEGPFLDGFYLSDVPEFEQWVTSERSRLESQYMVAIEHLATQAAARGDHGTTSHWIRALGSVTLPSAAAARRFVEALAAAGDANAGVEFAAQYADRVRAEVGGEPDSSVAALAERLRTARARATNDRREPLTAGEDLSGPLVRQHHTQRIAFRPIASAAAALLVLLAGWAWFTRSEGPRGDPNVIAVMPFRVTASDSSYNYLREGIVDLMNAHLTGDALPRAVDSRTLLAAWRRATHGRAELTEGESMTLARQLGAQKVLLGSLVITRSRSILTASLRDAASGREITPYRSEGTAGELKLIESLTSALLAHDTGPNEVTSPGLSDSLGAITEYLAGLHASRSNRWSDAYKHYSRAVRIDSTFALAVLRAYELALYNYGPEASVAAAPLWEVAWSLRERFSTRDMLLLRSMGAYNLHGDVVGGAEDRERALQVASDDGRIWTQLGRFFSYVGPLHYSDWYRLAIAALDSAIALDSTNAVPVKARLFLALHGRNPAEIRIYSALYEAVASGGQDIDAYRWAEAIAVNDISALNDLRSRAHAFSDLSVSEMVNLALIEGYPLADPERLLKQRLEQPLRDVASREGDVLQLFEVLTARGARNEALALVASAATDTLALGERVIRQAIFEPGTGYDSAAADFASVGARIPLHLYTRSGYCLTHIWLALNGTPTRARHAARALRTMADSSSIFGLRATRGGICPPFLESLSQLAHQPAIPESAMPQLDSILARGLFWDRTAPTANVVLARWQESLGDYRSALATIRRRARGNLDYQMAGRPAILRAEGKLAAIVGDTAGAIGAYAHYLTLRDKPDSGVLAKEVAEVRAHLAQLRRSAAQQP